MAKKLIDIVTMQFGDAVLDSHSRLGNDTVIVAPQTMGELAQFLRADERCQLDFLRDMTGVDYLNRQPRFEVVYILYSMALKHQLLVRVVLEEGDLRVPTVSHVWPIASWLEREVWDMYGIDFVGHPDLRRVLMYPEFEGHPLRKDYATQASQPRMELLARERDSVEEFNVFVKGREASGSRDDI